MVADRPLSHSHAVTAMMLAENGLRVPEGFLDFASDGRLSHFNVWDRGKPHDIVEKRISNTGIVANIGQDFPCGSSDVTDADVETLTSSLSHGELVRV
ncbi:hypothetical protein C357_03530 [Citreicella sp. 357]|nr:hypothetical protein C357_03530 [Citreicella sp. 357]